MEMYVSIEERFECSGMCRPSLFYFGRNMTEAGHPSLDLDSTCLVYLRKYMLSNGKAYALGCVLLCLVSLWLFIAVLCLYQKEGKTLEQLDREANPAAN